jgi:hypothetical protein
MPNISGSVYGRITAPFDTAGPLGISLTSLFACRIRVVGIRVRVVVIAGI